MRARRHRPHRAERSVRRAGAGLRSRAALRSRQTQRPRRRDRARPSDRRDRRADHDDAAARAAFARQAPRTGDAVHFRAGWGLSLLVERKLDLHRLPLPPHHVRRRRRRSRARARRACAGSSFPARSSTTRRRRSRIAQQHDDVWAAVGFHPHEAKDCDDAAFAEIERLATAAARRRDRRVRTRLPLHALAARDADRRASSGTSIWRKRARQADHRAQPRVDRRHGGDPLAAAARAASCTPSPSRSTSRGSSIDLGYYISFSGIVTFRTAEPLRDVRAARCRTIAC